MFRNSFSAKGLLALLLLACTAIPDAVAGGKSITWYLDGAKVEQVLALGNSYRELLLPATMLTGSFRAKPLGEARLARVELEPVKPGKGEEKELAYLDKRREELQDRLKALRVKEEIFKATAKSQGSKAPKRTRTNPEPLAAIRQGTDFAISRLEEVYSAMRKAERELRDLDRKQSALRKNEKVSGTVAKLWLAGKRGTVQLSYIISGEGWTPCYDIRVANGSAELTLMARLPDLPKADSLLVIPAELAASGNMAPIPIVAGKAAKVAVFRLPVIAEKQLPALQKTVEITLRNDSGRYLPSGDATGFWHEEFLGRTGFAGLKPAESTVLTFGSPVATGLETRKAQ
ncbi:hypothetical protein KI809_01320 [Geobacter pelophilus]|uniref:DUF4139 domain-containing protein n=1 Tax=Geoanaerobacter pelophilus TaxID=60036 RepID=A0AAW4KX68_9BACT|nr:hypothetical protein [Geoanaerobacter pelophilus]MBT0662924.1 hypothetical protein [Geoanaerobacter pelophilus]